MSRNFGVTRSGDLNSLPSWIFDHLGEGSSFMTDEVNQSPASPMEGSPPLEMNPLAAIHPSVEEKTNIMTLEKLDALREAYSFPSTVRVRLPEEGETIISARPSEVAYYEFAFPAGLRFPIHPIIKNLFSLNSNPKPDQGWLYFKVRNKKTLLGGYPNKHCNNPPRLYGDEPKVFKKIFKSVEKTGRFSVPVLLESKSFGRVFVSPGSMASGTAGESRPSSEAPSSSGDVGESQNSHEHARWSGRKVFDLIFNRNPSSGSNPTLESYSDLSQPVELDSDAMSKRISFKKLGEKLKKSKNRSFLRILAPAKMVVIGEKCTRESLASSASKKGKVDDGSKGKGVDREPKGKKKATPSSNALPIPATASSRLGEGTSATLDAALGPTASILGSPSVVEKLLRGVIPPADKEKVEKLTLDQTVTKLFHVIGQKLPVDLEQQLVEVRVREQQANDELAKMKNDRDSLTDKSEFVVAVEDSASKYFGEGFDFYKVQLRRHYPDLAIDLEGTMVDQDLLAEQDEVAEEREKEKAGENEGAIKILATKTYKAK
ncbi:hypothetical protein Acr_00g0017220 [Actinidia rufa]|uniref:Uncharacterized protein n=1 Tax=Actinidia rufa TaxID=165716 RepID=A0A7J0DCI5_9ERIC|nr:hypothetical protein Acr_00g0017220 [Actinidia rufa]